MSYASASILTQASVLHELATSADAMRTLYESVTAGILVVDAEGAIVHANRAAAALFGTVADDLAGARLDSPPRLLTDIDGMALAPERMPHLHTLRTGRVESGTTFGLYPHGTADICWLHLQTAPVLNDAGTVAQVVISMMDVSERVRHESGLRNAIAHGDAERAALTAAMAQEREATVAVQAELAGEQERAAALATVLQHAHAHGAALARELDDEKVRMAALEEDLARERAAEADLRAALAQEQARAAALAGELQDERERGETARGELEHERSVREQAVIGMEQHDVEGRIREANRALEEMLGYARGELRGKTIPEITHPDEVAGAMERLRQLFAEGSPDQFQTERRLLHKDGGIVWGFLSVALVRDTEERPLLAISWVTDITERKQAEARLHESEQRFRTLFESAPIGMARLTLDGAIEETNAALSRMLGYPDEVLRTVTLDGLRALDELPLDPVQVAEVAAGERDVHTMERFFLRQDGSRMCGQLTLSLVRGSADAPRFLLAMLEDVTERAAAEAALQHSALHDLLTDLPNRTLARDRTQQAILAARADSRKVALLLLDLDRFKEINDTFGHHHGDQLLMQIRPRLVPVLGPADSLARLGGDEFAVLMPLADEGTAAAMAQRLLATFDEPFTVEGHHLRAGASAGIALFPDHGDDAETLMRRADVAMYVAKRSGSGYAFYHPEEDQYSPARLTLTAELHRAIESGELRLHFQPVLDMRTGAPSHVEALVRWHHPRQGLLPPDRFIPLAEQIGLINPLARWVLETAVGQCAAWAAEGRKVPVAVNLSARNLHDPALPTTIAALLEQYGVAPSQLKLELTESGIMTEPEKAMAVLARLHDMGLRLSLDDFGTGYSSLAHLRRLPMTELKIDKSFVMDMLANENDAVIVRSTIELGHNLGLHVVAEGVETEAAWQRLMEWGCDCAQGYYISRPLPTDDLAQWFRAGVDARSGPARLST